MWNWFRNLYRTVVTVLKSLAVGYRYWVRSYDPKIRTFTEIYEYPELPAKIAPRFRGFHRYDLTSCIACERCVRDCPVGCIYLGKQRATTRKGFQVTSYTIDYGRCMFCGLCTEGCPTDCLLMGSSYDLSCYSREGTLVDFSRLPLEVAWGRATLNSAVVANAKMIAKPVHDGPGSC
ncbi:MAG: 4Fe-4S binding protein [Planctomycetaceae bacterium]|nr:4Fe-4S binding protein [Planctomycetaceae bacterium]